MKLFRHEYYADEAGQVVRAVTPIDSAGDGQEPIALGPPEFHIDFQIPVTLTDPNGRPVLQEVVGVPVRLDGATLADAFADIPSGLELAKKRAAEIVRAKMAEAKKQAEAASKALIVPGLNGHTPASRLRLRSGE